MSGTRDTSHSPITPYGSLGQSPFPDSLTHLAMAFSSCFWDCGANGSFSTGAGTHTVRDSDPDEPSNITRLFAFELTQAAPQSVCLNDVAPRNISAIVVTLDTSHFDMSLLNEVASRNIPDMSCTFDTSHFEMSPLNKTWYAKT